LRRVIVTTMQAVSGAGYPGVASLSILGNVIPYISGEERKVEEDRPQTRIDVDAGSVPGMGVSVGRIRVTDNIIRFISLSHNLIRGAAGGTILTAELAKHYGLLDG
jgi:aspartate-semialdehyde dehydrogenase